MGCGALAGSAAAYRGIWSGQASSKIEKISMAGAHSAYCLQKRWAGQQTAIERQACSA